MKPEIPQELLSNAAAFSEALATVQANLKTLVHSGAKPAAGPWILNEEMLSAPVPAIATLRASAEAQKHASAVCAELRALIEGRDIRALREHGHRREARRKRRENVARFGALVDDLEDSARRAVEECQARLHNSNDWSQAERVMQSQSSLRRSIRWLRASHWLYRLHCHPARPLGHVIDSLEEAMAAVLGTGARIAPVIPIRA
jgi:hypothetical protein